MDDFLGKPMELEELATKLAVAMGQRAATSTTGPLVMPPSRDEVRIATAAIERLRLLCGDDPVVLADLIGDHLVNSAKLRISLHEALDRDDREALQLHALSLKGTTAMFGAEAVARLASALEELAHDGAPAVLASALARLDHAHDAAVATLARLAR